MTNAQAAVQRKQNELRQIKAEVDGEARPKRCRAEAAGQQARAEAELELQKIRGELEQLRLEAEVTIPAEIDAAGPRAVRGRSGGADRRRWRGDGARRSPRSRPRGATAAARAMDMFVLQHLDAIFGDVAKAAQRIKVGEVNLIDGGDGKTIPAYAASYPATMAALLEQVTSTLGVDIAKVITGNPTTGSRS